MQRWTDVSWFLDEAEVATRGGDSGATSELPKAWRLGNRPNLRQMHDDACRNRVPPALIESQLVDAIERQRMLTSGASAAGARVHNLPARPRDIADDGAFHYAVLGPRAASEPGKPSAEARTFIEQTTTPDRPRVYRNAVVLAVPSRDGLDAARTRIRDYLGWEEVRAQLRDQPIDPLREQMLAAETAVAGKRVPDAVRSAYCMVVTVSESDAIHAFRVVVGDEPLFTTIKADRRSRIQETAISSDAMLPGGPTTCGARTSNRGGSRIWWAHSRSSRSCRRCCGPRRYSIPCWMAFEAGSGSLGLRVRIERSERSGVAASTSPRSMTLAWS